MLELSPMDNDAATVSRMNELPDRTKEFLSKLDEDDIETLEDAMQFYATVRTLGRVGKWTILTILAIIVGFVSLYENMLKMAGWWASK
ncbi:hypothetical protein ACTOV4_00685 [Brucella sp. C7-11G]